MRPGRSRREALPLLRGGSAVALLTLLALLAAGCARSNATHARTGPGFNVVAAESVWGSIARQLAGSQASVTSIVVNPSTDPHDYQPSARDARALADAGVAIVNGLGYDTWASKLLAASPASGRSVVDVGAVLGRKDGDNPHQWYDPAAVLKVAAAITAAYSKLDPGHTAYFAARKQHFEDVSLERYDRLRAEIRKRFAGVPVGFSESIFEPLGRDLELRLLTPVGFAKAVTEGTDVSARDKQTVEDQVRKRLIKVWVFNSQNTTPDIQRINAICEQRHVPLVTVTETLSPASASFEQWQVAQLRALITALHEATGR